MRPQESDLNSQTRNQVPEQTAVFPWFAVQVWARHEARVAHHLRGKGYRWFLPLHKCRKRWSDRVKIVDAPLFPGYLFCRFNPESRLRILTTPGVIQIVGINGSPAPIDETEIEALQTVVVSGLPSEPWPFLAVGHRVRIESGPLCDLEGTVVKHKGHHRLVLSVTLLQRSVAVEIDSASVSPLHCPVGRAEERYGQPTSSPLQT